jgi:hypothetical protein
MKKTNSTIVKIQKQAKSELSKEKSEKVTSKKNDVKKVVKVETKVVKPVFTYKNVESETINKDFGKYLKSQGKEVTDRMKERNIKLDGVVKISKQVQHQLVGSKIRSIATKFYFKLKDGSTKIFNFSVFEKI